MMISIYVMYSSSLDTCLAWGRFNWCLGDRNDFSRLISGKLLALPLIHWRFGALHLIGDVGTLRNNT